MDKAKIKHLEKKGWIVGNAYDFLGFTPEEKETAEANNQSPPAGRAGGEAVVGLPWWEDIKQMLLKKYEDKPNDYHLSIGHWEDTIGLGYPQFTAYLKITLKELRST